MKRLAGVLQYCVPTFIVFKDTLCNLGFPEENIRITYGYIAEEFVVNGRYLRYNEVVSYSVQHRWFA